MSDFVLMVLLGPCLMTAIAAAALYFGWRGLSPQRHVLAWSGGFALMSLALVVRVAGTRAGGGVYPGVSAIVQLLGLGTTLLLAEGFASRAGRPGFIARTIPLSIGAALILGGMAIAGLPSYVTTTFAATAQGALLLWSAALVLEGMAGVAVAELLALGVLFAVGMLRLTAAISGVGRLLGLAAAGNQSWLPAIMIEPACVALIAMFLIASDLSIGLNRLALTDPLTNVLNRAGFEDAAASALRKARFPHRPLSIAIADIDRFKAINDRHGHAAGDAALTSFAETMARALGAQWIGRIGGEEFALLLPAHDAYRAFERIEPIRALAEAMPVAGHDAVRLTASFGIAEMAHGETLASLLARADRALYHSKQTGRNRCSLAALQDAG